MVQRFKLFLSICVLSRQSFLIAAFTILVRYTLKLAKSRIAPNCTKLWEPRIGICTHLAFYSDTAQQILTGVAESFKSFLGLQKGIKNGTVAQRPKLPGYRQGGMALVTFTGRSVKLKDGMLRFPLLSKVKAWFGLDAFFLPMPSNLDFKAIREYRILPRNGCFYLESIYKSPDIQTDVDPAKCLTIDHGMDNWLTCLSNVGTSFIVDGKHLKSINQGYNKRVAFLMKGKANGYWSKRLASLTEKRNRQMRDAVNKAARKVIHHCVKNRIGTVIFG